MSPKERIKQWADAAKTAKQWQEYELHLRQELFRDAFPKAIEGTNTIDLGGGYKLVATVGYNITVENANGEADACAQYLANKGPAVFAWTPRLLLKGYRDLSDVERGEVDKLLTIKPKTPSLKLIVPDDTN